MKDESLIKAKELLTDIIGSSDIDEVDKLELLINLYAFLSNKSYENNINTLRKELESRKYNGSNDKVK